MRNLGDMGSKGLMCINCHQMYALDKWIHCTVVKENILCFFLLGKLHDQFLFCSKSYRSVTCIHVQYIYIGLSNHWTHSALTQHSNDILTMKEWYFWVQLQYSVNCVPWQGFLFIKQTVSMQYGFYTTICETI